MITGFGFTAGIPSATYSSDAYADGIPSDVVEIGLMMALEDAVHFGTRPRGYDHVAVAAQSGMK